MAIRRASKNTEVEIGRSVQIEEEVSEATASKPFASKVRRDPIQEITDKMLVALEEGTAPWQQPWLGRFGRPMNPTTGKAYRGINVLLLAGLGLQDGRFCSYKQAQKQGWQVRSGERAHEIYFYKPFSVPTDKVDPDTMEPMMKVIPVFRSYPVFSLTQIDGAPPPEIRVVRQEGGVDPETSARIEAMVAASGIEVISGRSRASYSPATDKIAMPMRESFRSDGDYYATLLHEMAHATGHESRLNRKFSFDRESPEYAREELRAEMASAFLSMHLGIPSNVEGHESYVAHYIELLKSDKRELLRAAKDAELIATHVLSLDPGLREELQAVSDARRAEAEAAGMPEEVFDASMFPDLEEAVFEGAEAVESAAHGLGR